MQNQSDGLREKKKHAKIRLTLRILVALYILYLTKGIVTAAIKNTSSLPLWVTVLVSAVFLAASVAFGIYAWRDYKSSAASASEWQTECSGQSGKNPPGGTGRK